MSHLKKPIREGNEPVFFLRHARLMPAGIRIDARVVGDTDRQPTAQRAERRPKGRLQRQHRRQPLSPCPMRLLRLPLGWLGLRLLLCGQHFGKALGSRPLVSAVPDVPQRLPVGNGRAPLPIPGAEDDGRLLQLPNLGLAISHLRSHLRVEPCGPLKKLLRRRRRQRDCPGGAQRRGADRAAVTVGRDSSAGALADSAAAGGALADSAGAEGEARAAAEEPRPGVGVQPS
mmetsp:Transcript_15532/g.50703  ORF Transcript_15532/g.50703 Transcript_15532/m.50703 type:complete len:230 (+) Transcript_15532:198-887(+)